MNKKLILFSTLGLSGLITTILLAGAVISKFEGKDAGNKVVLQWVSVIESNLDFYEIERSLDQKNYSKLGKVTSQGPATYSFTDLTVFKATTHTFYYRLKLVDHSGNYSYYGQIITIKPSISGIRHTWGSLKAMFR
ncbi:hypothetical protein L0128_18600 [candidate division KSB1 bacterium]|nr:hypothetical protein [candidate division KSB1 bacterium]